MKITHRPAVLADLEPLTFRTRDIEEFSNLALIHPEEYVRVAIEAGLPVWTLLADDEPIGFAGIEEETHLWMAGSDRLDQLGGALVWAAGRLLRDLRRPLKTVVDANAPTQHRFLTFLGFQPVAMAAAGHAYEHPLIIFQRTPE